MELTEAYRLTRKVLDLYELSDWTIVIEQNHKARGVCHYEQRCIMLQDSMIAKAKTFSDLMPTVLHEIAHAKSTEHGHGVVWAKKLRELIAHHVFGIS